MTDVRAVGVAGLHWMVANQPQIGYSEQGDRMLLIAHPWVLPFVGDCSSTDTGLFKWIGLNDPNRLGYDGNGDTQTFGANAISSTTEPSKAQPLDAVIYGLNGPLDVQHQALVVATGDDPMTVSHGDSYQPGYVPAMEGDPTQGAYGPPQFFHYDTTAVFPIIYPPGYKLTVRPGSHASKVDPKYLPAGKPPILKRGMDGPYSWILFGRLCLREAGYWRLYLPVTGGGDGLYTTNALVRYERETINPGTGKLFAPDGIFSQEVWTSFGLEGVA